MQEDFGDRLRRIIVDRGTKITAVASLSGVSARTIEGWTAPARKSKPSILDAYAVASALGVSLEYLITGRDRQAWIPPSRIAKIVDGLGVLPDADLSTVADVVDGLVLRRRVVGREFAAGG